jgi:hypothetical protein
MEKSADDQVNTGGHIYDLIWMFQLCTTVAFILDHCRKTIMDNDTVMSYSTSPHTTIDRQGELVPYRVAKKQRSSISMCLI